MHKSKQIAIILTDTLQITGLQSILLDYFPPVTFSVFYSFQSAEERGIDLFDFYFVSADTFVLYSEFFLPRRNKTIVLTSAGEMKENANAITSNFYLNITSPLELIIDRFQQLFNYETNGTENNKGLSARETDVLQLIVKGITNKEIADKLNISLNTVLSHRKNITSKLGIKTISGLTYYAIMNGFISADEIEI
ncbi:MAG: LuxR C-terminal-related transcriptional regulator [Massilibacteroides sp.]|nr:LuxR C-terminal-related transcriptional regulator [Massilibacteroides sp.]MDD3063062.1 LuxR C-terminal-related transcriptional regulator [Massilibacteroides sp.]MDD4114280.1 LuxR C-terminal-related transcriptional regulator [Massilibacteroides sp.]MDD4660377.1 LuxR C-terminal-related transcriptional regulator [Massilibacteroides sp.]